MITKSSFIQERDNSMKKAHMLVRRVSDMFKDGTYSGPPSLFSQKLRHCCQNLNLFPYLLYSFDNSKSHPLAKKVNLYFNLLIQNLVHRFLFVSTNLRRVVICNLQRKSLLPPTKESQQQHSHQLSCTDNGISSNSSSINSSDEETESRKRLAKLRSFPRHQKTKPSPALVLACVYLAPLVLTFQLLGLCGLLVHSKYTPGFVFLFVALLTMGFIKIKIVFCNKLEAKENTNRRSRDKKRKDE